jgi:serine phosphatase RsbU (regulator of sigma subunit)
MISIACLALLAALLPTALTARTSAADPRPLDATSYGQRIVLGPNWLFAPGDNPAWASSTFDDGGWTRISTRKQLFDYGFHDIRFGWYRMHIHLRPDAPALMVGVEDVEGSYQVYANGRLIGGNERMEGLAFIEQYRLLAFPVPREALNPSGDLVVAIRFKFNPNGIQGAGLSTPIDASAAIYLESPEAFNRDASYNHAHWTAGWLILSALALLVGLVALGLFAALRDRREYLAAAVYLVASSCLYFFDALMFIDDHTPLLMWIDYALFAITSVAVIEFIRLVLSQRSTRWLLGLEAAVFFCAFWSPLTEHGLAIFHVGFVLYFAPILATRLVLLVLLLRAWRAGNLEARILLPAVLLEGLYRYWQFLLYLLYYVHLTPVLHSIPSFHADSYEITLRMLSDAVFRIAVLLFLVLRTVGIARRHTLAAAELEAARVVQQVLVPEEVPTVAGFVLESVYKPAGQVGGDFFQIIAIADGGVLVAIGDVSGKGMPAAMTVSLLVGTLRTLAHYTQSPGEILAAMNQRMLGRNNGGFTTCLVLSVSSAGILTAANAGHIGPYLNGNERLLESGLPIGIAAGITYPETTFTLPPSARLTLITDGVLEATNPATKELFGFDRTAAISNQSAEAIALAAQQFGQEDDITLCLPSLAPTHSGHGKRAYRLIPLLLSLRGAFSPMISISRLALLAALLPVTLAAQTSATDPRNVDASRFGERIDLGPNWLFAPGDNPAWAAPSFDDSAWITVSTKKQLFDYGIRDVAYGWYRLHIHVRPGTRGLSVGMQSTYGSYEVFANGVRIGGNGPFPPLYRFNQYGFYAYSIPDGLVSPQGDLILAIRFGLNAVGGRGNGTSTPISDSIDSEVFLLSGESAPREAFYAIGRAVIPNAMLAGLSLLVGLVSLALFLALRKHREYLAAAVYMFAFCAWHVLWGWWNTSELTMQRGLVTAVFFGAIAVAQIEFICRVIGVKRNRWITAFQIIGFLTAFCSPLSSAPFFPYYFALVSYYVSMMVIDVWLAVLLARAWMRGNMEARVLLPALLLTTFADYWSFFNYAIFIFHLVPAYHQVPHVHVAGLEFGFLQVGDFFSFITVLLFLVLRTIGIARERARATAELEAARSVQQILIPDEMPAIPGYELRSIYNPAGEVGGDFFQIVSVADGGVLIAIGDVSGKGMPAAMTVSLLVGTFRTLAHYTSSPGEILSAMNQRMLARSHGGFTTCLVLRGDEDGGITIANAGHIAPYLAGDELHVENGLPLGLSASAVYEESSFQFGPGQQLTLMTDGVVEARSASGELFGFERTAAISTQSADEIAAAAQSFGQEDDITVLTLTFSPASDLVEAIHA